MNNSDVKLEYPEESIPEPGQASFKGRLNLAEYTFSPKLVPSRHSPCKSEQSTSLYSKPTAPKRKSTTTNLSSSPSPRKKVRSSSGYAPPSTYAHLPELRDVLAPNLICVFIGLNPGLETSRSGHAYAHPSNLFWKLLHSSGCTTRRCRPDEDGSLPELFQLGNTNIVRRPTRNGSELSKKEMDQGVAVLEEKVGRFRPESVCVVGKSIWESVFRVKNGWGLEKGACDYGWQKGVRMGRGEGGDGASIFVACSTSGLAATVRPEEKQRIWRDLGIWVEERRRMRADNVHEESLRNITELVKVEESMS